MMKKIFLLLFLNFMVSFLGAMDSDLPNEIRIRTFKGEITNIPLNLVRCSRTLFSKLNQDSLYEHTTSPGIELSHIECLKEMVEMIQTCGEIETNENDETALLDTLRNHYNTKGFNNSDQHKLKKLIKSLGISIPSRPDILKKMFTHVKIQSENGTRSLYIPRRKLDPYVLKAMIETDDRDDELVMEGIPFELFDGAQLLFAGNEEKTDDIRTLVECLYTMKQLSDEEKKQDDFSLYVRDVSLCTRIVTLIRNGVLLKDSNALCEEFSCLKKDTVLGPQIATNILREIKDTYFITPMTLYMQLMITMADDHQDVKYDDVFSVEVGESYYGAQKTMTIIRKATGSSVVTFMPFSLSYSFSPNKRFLFVAVYDDRGTGVLIDLEHLPVAKQCNLGDRYNKFSKAYFSPNSEYLALLECYPESTYGIKHCQTPTMILVNTSTNEILKTMAIDCSSECKFSKNSKYIKVNNLEKQPILINVDLLNASTLEEGISALYDQNEQEKGSPL